MPRVGDLSPRHGNAACAIKTKYLQLSRTVRRDDVNDDGRSSWRRGTTVVCPSPSTTTKAAAFALDRIRHDATTIADLETSNIVIIRPASNGDHHARQAGSFR